MQVAQALRSIAIEEATIQMLQDEALLKGLIDGKNEAIREAQLRQIAAAPRERLQRVQDTYRTLKMDLNILDRQFKACRMIAALFSRSEEE